MRTRTLLGLVLMLLLQRVSLVAQKGMMTGGGFLESIATLVEPKPPGAPLRVLIIDDSATNCRVVSGMLTAAGHEHAEAQDAAMGIEIARASRPDVILMDIRMPGMDGLEATRILRRDPRTSAIPIIAVSAQAMLGDRERAIEAGCVGYVAKPVARVELLETIARAVTRCDPSLPPRRPALSDRLG